MDYNNFSDGKHIAIEYSFSHIHAWILFSLELHLDNLNDFFSFS